MLQVIASQVTASQVTDYSSQVNSFSSFSIGVSALPVKKRTSHLKSNAHLFIFYEHIAHNVNVI